MSTREERNMMQMQKTFVLPRVMRFAGTQNWPAPVPTFAQVNEFIPQTCRLPYDYLFRDNGRAMAECTLLVWEYTGLDMIGANHDFYNFEAESIGAKINFYKSHIPDVNRNDFLIKSSKDLDKIKFLGLDSGRYRYLIEYCHAYTSYVGLDTFPSFCAPWSLACNLYGLENLLIETQVDPAFVHELLQRIVYDLQGPMLKAMAAEILGFNAISVADAWTSPPMVSLDILHEYTVPYTLKLPEAMGQDVPVNNSGIWGSSCFDDTERRDDFMRCVLEMGQYVAAFDPDQDKVGIQYYRDFADKMKAPLLLGFSTSLLQDADIVTIVERTKRYTLKGKSGNTSLLFFYNHFAPQTPIDHIRASIAAVHTYGVPEATVETPFAAPETAESFEEFLRNKIENNVEGYTFHWLEKSEYSHLMKG
ncbi:MAG: uroporphyrinogen decarboxylase family protein [Lachnospiraceae bacterium]